MQGIQYQFETESVPFAIQGPRTAGVVRSVLIKSSSQLNSQTGRFIPEVAAGTHFTGYGMGWEGGGARRVGIDVLENGKSSAHSGIETRIAQPTA
jgi:hypothetical protein